MVGTEDLLQRIKNVKKLKENCFKYLEESSKDLLTHKILYAIAEISSEKLGPVRLSEISKFVYGESDKAKQDLIRLTIGKSLLKCGLIEKLRYSSNDVRYILTGYRFQKVKEIDSFRGESTEPIGDVFELPKSTWPIPNDFFTLLARKHGCEQALKKINSDFDNEIIPRGKYEDLINEYSKKIQQINEKIDSSYSGIEGLVES